ncbi:hypothetical protein D3C74_442170 [compost metagenome]
MCRFIRRRFVAADVHSHRNPALLNCLQPPRHGFGAFIIEAHPVNQRFVRQKTEQTRAVIARLALRRDSAHFHKTKADG